MIPLKTRKTDDIIQSYQQFLNFLKNRYNLKPVKIITDDEFNNKQFLDLNIKNNILVDYQTSKDDHIIGGNRLGIIDSFTRTIK
jgi:hypothetical protein